MIVSKQLAKIVKIIKIDWTGSLL